MYMGNVVPHSTLPHDHQLSRVKILRILYFHNRPSGGINNSIWNLYSVIIVASNGSYGISNYRQLHCYFVEQVVKATNEEKLKTRIWVLWIHRSPVDSPHKGPIFQKRFKYDCVVMVIVIEPCIDMMRLEHNKLELGALIIDSWASIN